MQTLKANTGSGNENARDPNSESRARWSFSALARSFGEIGPPLGCVDGKAVLTCGFLFNVWMDGCQQKRAEGKKRRLTGGIALAFIGSSGYPQRPGNSGASHIL
jgi:hypothetical protein